MGFGCWARYPEPVTTITNESRSRRRHLLGASLTVGAIVSVALLVASFWVAQLPLSIAAVVVALVGGFLAVWAVTVEFREWRERSQEEGETARAEERDRTRVFHVRQREVLSTVDVRTKATQESLSQVTASLGKAEAQISTLRGDNEALTIENKALKVENTELREQLAPDPSEQDGAVLALPLRTAAEGGMQWSDLEAPTVVNLDLIRLASPLLDEVKRAHAN